MCVGGTQGDDESGVATMRRKGTAIRTRRGLRGKAKRECRAAPQRWVGRSGGFRKKPGNETAKSHAQWAKDVMNNRAGKRGTRCWGPLQEEAGCLSGAARRDGLRLRACARTGCECWRECQHEQTQREPEMRRQRRDCESGVPGTGDATMEEWNKKPASQPWLPTGPSYRKG